MSDDPRSDARILRTSGQIYRLVARSIPGIGILVFDKSLRILVLEGGWMIKGLLPGCEWLSVDYVLPSTGRFLRFVFQDALDGLSVELDYPFQGKLFRLNVVPIRNEDNAIVAGMVVCRDVTLENDKRKKLEQEAWMDSVTGLRNRRGFLSIAPARISHGNVALLSLDLDGFKAINDTYGHPTGDFVLGTVAKRMSDCLRREDIASRYGGDEFVILLSGVKEIDEARGVAERIVAKIGEPIALPDRQLVYITASIGLTLGDTSESFEAMYKRVDSLLYESKKAGKNRVTA